MSGGEITVTLAEDGQIVIDAPVSAGEVEFTPFVIEGPKGDKGDPGVSGGGAGSTQLSELLDVDVLSRSDGDLLRYNQQVGKWKNTAPLEVMDGGNF